MKKIIALLLFVTLLLCSFTACGAINKKAEVAVLWANMSDEYQFTISDALDRAMYIKHLKYTHYDAEKSASTQLEQADNAIKNGAGALIVCATDVATATAILSKAQEADIPVVFLCNDILVDLAVTLLNYQKCYVVNVDFTNRSVALGERIASDLIKNYDEYDRDKDGVISYASFGVTADIATEVNKKLVEEGKPELSLKANHLFENLLLTQVIDGIFKDYDNSQSATPIELILTDSDDCIEEMLLALRKYEFNHNKLVTHFIPLYTIGVSANAGELIDSEEQEEKDAFSVMNAIDKGWLSASALEDDDTLALCTCTILANVIKGKPALEKINADFVEGNVISVPYAIYG